MRIITDLFRRKPKTTSTYYLRLRLLSIVEETGYEVDSLRGIIERLDGPTIVAVSQASKYPDYGVVVELETANDNTEIRDVALYYAALKELGVGRPMFTLYLQELSRLTGVTDLATLHKKSPTGAQALLRLVGILTYFNFVVYDIENPTIHPDLVDLVLEQPHQVDTIVDFLQSRNDLTILTLHPQVFLDAVKFEAQSLRDGIL